MLLAYRRVLERWKALLILGSLAASLLVFELGFRALESALGVDRELLGRFRRFVLSEGRVATFAPHPYTLYTRRPGDKGVNSLGFLDDEVDRSRRPDVPRIACLGSSTTESGNALHHQGSYPHFLAAFLKQRMGREVEVLNFGMSGWTSAETLVNYLLVVQDYVPDVVLIHEAVNDAEPRAWPDFREDYSHYRKPWTDLKFPWGYRALVWLSDAFVYRELRSNNDFEDIPVTWEPAGPYRFGGGLLPPGTALPFRRNVRTIVEHVRLRAGHAVLITMPYDLRRSDQGAAVYRSAIDEHNAILRELAREQGVTLVDLDAQARGRFESLAPFFFELVHLTPEGNRWKAEAIAGALLAGRLL